ncbi:MAG: segregation/condensation protein A, partial [Cyclobacteriaceae bacterium]|nr:segregation/condensation protein A [Cyclobacteriaceae bacterium]
RPQLDEEGNEIDPREELVMHLLEYKKYKSVLQELASMESDMFQKEKRGNVLKEIKKLSETVNVESELQDIDLYKLLKVYQKVLKRFEIESQKPTHQVVQYPFTVEQQKDFILNKVMEKKKLSFTQIVEYNREKIGVIYNFLAILELLQLQQIMIRIGEGYNNFWIERLEKELA